MSKYRFEQIVFNSTEKKKPTEEDKYTYLGLEHLDSGSLHVTRYGSDVAPIGEKLIMREGDVLFGKRRAYQKKVAIAPFDGIFSAHGMVLRPKEEVIDKNFFPFFISSDYFLDAAIKISVGSLSPTINWRDLKELEFELPEMDKQRGLAKVLWAIDATKKSYQKLLLKTDELVKSQFIEMFGEPVNGGLYEKAAIGKLGDIMTGTTPPMKNPEYYDSDDILFIKPGDIAEDSVTAISSAESFISEKARRVGRIFPKNSVLVTCIGTIGKVGIVMQESSCNQQINVIVPGASVNHVYLAYCMLYMKDLLKGGANAPVVPILNKGDFSKIEIMVPPFVLQEQFAAFVRQSDKSKIELEQALAELTATYKKIISENLG
jgi:type I restriction enzyme, S subunit